MKVIELVSKEKSGITIMIFTEGTLIKHKALWALYYFSSYRPIGNAVAIIKEWERQGANIIYCTSRRNRQAKVIAQLLKKHGFIGTRLVYREKKETYQHIVETIKPTILIEDDCKSIGGTRMMCITNVAEEIKRDILSVVVPEFKGIDHLPICLKELCTISSSR